MPTSFNVWTPLGNVLPNGTAPVIGFSNPNVIFDTNSVVLFPGTPATSVFKMWCMGLNGVTYGVYYFESANGKTSWTAYSGNPIITSAAPLFDTVYKNGSTYFLYAGDGSITAWTSPDGVTLTTHGNVIQPTAATWDSSGVFQLNIVDIIAGTWYGYYSGTNGTVFGQGLATSPDGLVWTKSPSNPIFPGPIGNSAFLKVDSTHYYMYAPGRSANAQLATIGSNPMYRYSASSPSGPWTQLQFSGKPVAVYYPALQADFVSGSELSSYANDQSLVVANGNIYMYYTVTHTGGIEAGVNAAEAIGFTPSQLVATYEGVVNAPFSGLPQLNNVTLDTADLTGANQNPLAGAWTEVTGFNTAQLISNLIEPTASAATAIYFRNSLTWTADQWGQATASISLNTSSVGSTLRGSTTGATSVYRFYWTGTLGSSGTWIIFKHVAGVGTQLASGTGLTVSAGDTIGGAIIGSSLLLYYNGFLIYQIIDAALAAGAPGFIEFGNGAATNAAISAWSGGTFQAAPPINPMVSVYSVPDCRVAPFGPNASRTVQSTLIYDVQTSSNPAISPTDSRAAKPIASGAYPQNSRTPGTFGPGVN